MVLFSPKDTKELKELRKIEAMKALQELRSGNSCLSRHFLKFIRLVVSEGGLTLEEIGTNEEELRRFNEKAEKEV